MPGLGYALALGVGALWRCALGWPGCPWAGGRGAGWTASCDGRVRDRKLSVKFGQAREEGLVAVFKVARFASTRFAT